jgi:transposase
MGWTERALSAITREIARAGRRDERIGRLKKGDGIGVLTASALVAFAGDAHRFRNARAFVA